MKKAFIHPEPAKLLPWLAQYADETMPHRYIIRHLHEQPESVQQRISIMVDDLTKPELVSIHRGPVREMIFAQTSNTLVEFVKQIRRKNLFFAALPERHAKHLRDSYHVEFENATRLFIIDDDWVAPEAPEYPTETIRETDAELVCKLWPYGDDATYIIERIRLAPNVAVYLDDKLAAFVITHSDGSMGALHVMDEHRGKGLAQLITVKQIEKLRALGDTPWVAVVVNNKASLGLVARMGFREVGQASWMMIKKD